MKIGITCGGIGAYASGEFLHLSARAAEEVGFNAYWMPDHVVLFADYPESRYAYANGSGQAKPQQDDGAALKFGEENPIPDPHSEFVDPVAAMAWVAAVTSRIEVGSNVLILPQRNPVVLAKSLASIDSFSGGRVVLGAGIGWAREEYAAVGAQWQQRGKRADEYIGALRALWGEGGADFEGETVQLRGAYAYPKPARPGGIPILIGGESEAALRRVASAGDGWLPFNLPVEDAAQTIAHLKALTREQGRDPEQLRIVKIIFSNAELDDLKRYREAGVTEFNLASNGELPLEKAGIEAVMAEFAERFVEPLRRL